MSKRKYIIMWQAWVDPISTLQSNNRISSHYDDLDDDEFNPMVQHHMIKSMPMMATPMGIFPIPTPDTSTFDFWVGHTNFDITPPIFQMIDTIEGVESLDIFTRYRFRIGVGRAFSSTDVKHKISNIIYKYLTSNGKKKNNIST